MAEPGEQSPTPLPKPVVEARITADLTNAEPLDPTVQMDRKPKNGKGRRVQERPARSPEPMTPAMEEGMLATQAMLRDHGVVDTLAALTVQAEKLKDRLQVGLIKVTTPGTVLGGIGGAVGIAELGAHDQTAASLIAALDEPAAAAIFAAVWMGKKIQTLRGENTAFKSWLWDSLQTQCYKLRYQGAKESIAKSAKPVASTAAILMLAYLALENEALAEPINLFLGGSMGALLGSHTEGMIRGRESFSTAIEAYARMEFPTFIKDARNAARNSIQGTKTVLPRKHQTPAIDTHRSPIHPRRPGKGGAGHGRQRI